MPRPFIPYSRQTIEDDDVEAVVRALRSDWLTQGPAIERFERAVADYCGAPQAVAVSSATAGLHLACLALGVSEGDVVWTSPLSFAASANCAHYCGAEVDFVDIDTGSGNMSVAALAAKLGEAARARRLPKLIIPVHYAGRACDMEAIGALKERYGFHVIEDAAHALGAQYADGSPVGGHAAADAAVFSFHPVKPVTTGEGGMVVTQDAGLADRIRPLRTHGITRDPSQLQQKNMPAWYYEMQRLGFNYRITDIQAALGISQMAKLDRFIRARRTLAERYRHLLRNSPLTLPPPGVYCGWHLYVVQVDARDAVFEKMREQNIGVNVHYMPIHLQPYYRALGFKEGWFPKAEAFFKGALSLPLHPRLTEREQDDVVAALRDALVGGK
ncbi:MAG: UDP-4-amino-4,6-dideoxy-N-acetyl-beta-L-altrosamine transaminase [Pseudomonadota bacterium]|nr:UDP-4-amino-4,6-dideoxy-N-acetyl-beta-L-altrosamine transaminase [Pseudomonadota bacterium]MDE3038083.1 UDP-4-amino-4,6-dideoxy-N-acetyl-beta-L-altrosamine transaminase [Pseudomonadota bacterium]